MLSTNSKDQFLWFLGGLLCCSFFYSHTSSFPYVNDQMIEICDNAIDDDGDGLIDLNDEDCDCAVEKLASLVPNASFENTVCCPEMSSRLRCLEGWKQASTATTDYLNTCGWNGFRELTAPFPYPSGNGVLGFRDGVGDENGFNSEPNWKEYAGACLLKPLLKDTVYSFDFQLGFVNSTRSPAINITFFGSTDCSLLPFGGNNPTIGCPTNTDGWVKLGSKLMSTPGPSSWEKGQIEVIPNEDIYAIAIGPACEQSNTNQSTYYFFDDLILNKKDTFSFSVSDVGHPCSEDYYLEAIDLNASSYQWYLEGIALLGESSHQISQMYGDGEYKLRILIDGDCFLSAPFIYAKPILKTFTSSSICEGEVNPLGEAYPSITGTYIDTLVSMQGCDSISSINLTVEKEQIFNRNLRIFEGEEVQIGNEVYYEEGLYTIVVPVEGSCDSIVFVQINYYQVYIPTIFSPNNDGFNDEFKILSDGTLQEVKRMEIYDRWGNIMYESNRANQGWDGISDGQELSSGTYVYVVTVIMNDGKERTISGSVLLVR